MANTKYIWKDRKRTFLGLPWSFTRYALTDEKLIIDTGFFSRVEDEVRLYRIMDLTLRRSLWERIFGVGTIHCCSGDKSMGEFDIKHIKDPKKVKDMISEMVEAKRQERRVGMREYMNVEGEDDEPFEGIEEEDSADEV